ncbi:MAG: tyrosine-type recombinase/integrase [Candidatus Bathyarchaeota archaeon]|nr:tyrosine-type recombinase/integrase [Candidatus Bathyarchaeota archaeon]
MEKTNSWRKELLAKYGWSQQESVKRWVEKLKTKTYAEACFRWGLKIHCKETGKTPDQLINKRVEQVASPDPRIRSEAEDTVLRIHSHLAEMATGTAINYFRKMKSFYKHNYCPLGCTDPGYDVQNEVKDRRAVEKLSSEKIRNLCEQAQIETRLAIMILAESGGRIGAVQNLTYGDVKDDLETGVIPASVWLKQQSRKKGKTYPSFICSDAVKLLKIVLAKKRNRTDKTKIFNNGRDTNQQFLRDNDLHAHLFRKRFQVILEDAGVPVNWVDRLQGRIPRGAQGKTYSLPPIAKLRKHYTKAMKELVIYGASESNGQLSEALAKVLSRYLQRAITTEEIQEVLDA